MADQPAPDSNRLAGFLRDRAISLSQIAALLLALGSFGALFAAHNAFADVLVNFRHLFALGALAAAVVLIIVRHRVLAAVAVVTVLVNLAFIADAMPVGGSECSPNLTVVTLNALGPDNDIIATLAQLADANADIVVVTEAGRALDAALTAKYGHSFSFPDEGTRGMGIYSRFPLRAERKLPGAWFPQLIVRATVEGKEVTIYAAHPPPPISGLVADLRNEEVRGIAVRLKELKGPVILAGDFNMTRQSPHFQQLIAAGLVDGRVGQGVLGTWPAVSPFRVGIDHVLHSPDIATCDLATGDAAGSDHLPLVAALRM